MSGQLTVITGCMFSGKCLKKGTNVLMFDGYTKKVEDIIVGDQLMGDDSTVRNVLSTTNGTGDLYIVTPPTTYGDPYVINEHHILSLYQDDQIIDIPIKQYLDKVNDTSCHYQGFCVSIEFPYQEITLEPYQVGQNIMLDFLNSSCEDICIPYNYIANTTEIRGNLLAGLMDIPDVWVCDVQTQTYHINIDNNILSSQIVFLVRTLGLIAYHDKIKTLYIKSPISSSTSSHHVPLYTYKTNKFDIKVQYEGIGQYYGFTLDNNGRFLLGDLQVTHNSTELQRQVRRLELSGKTCLIIKHKSDTRYGKAHECCTHDLKTMPAIATQCLWDIKDKCQKYDVIAIDEVQFFPEIIEFVEEMVEQQNKIMIVAGLDGTYQGKPFGRVGELLPISDQFMKLTAICRNCGKDAPFTVRRSDFQTDKDQIEIVGADELYEAICRSCRAKRNMTK